MRRDKRAEGVHCVHIYMKCTITLIGLESANHHIVFGILLFLVFAFNVFEQIGDENLLDFSVDEVDTEAECVFDGFDFLKKNLDFEYDASFLRLQELSIVQQFLLLYHFDVSDQLQQIHSFELSGIAFGLVLAHGLPLELQNHHGSLYSVAGSHEYFSESWNT